MGRFLDEAPAKTYKGKFLDEEPVKTVTPEVLPPPGKRSFLNDASASRDAFVNSASFGGLDIADWAARKLVPMNPQAEEKFQENYGRPKARTGLGKVAEFGSGVAGGIMGGPGKVAENVAARVLPNAVKRTGALAFGARRLRDTASGVTAGALYPGDLGQRAFSATMGGVISPVAGAAQEGAKPLANRLMIQAIKPSKETLKRIPDFGNKAADAGFYGTLDRMKGKAISYLDDLEPKLQAALKGSSKKIKTQDVLDEFSEMERRALNANDDATLNALDNVQKALKNQGPEMTLEQANQLKRDFYSLLKDSQWGKGQGEIPALAGARKTGAYGLKKQIDIAEPSVKPMNEKTGLSAEVLEGVNKQQEKSLMKSILPWVETIGSIGGLASGNPWLTAAILARRGAVSPTVLSTVGKVLNNSGGDALRKALISASSETNRRLKQNE